MVQGVTTPSLDLLFRSSNCHFAKNDDSEIEKQRGIACITWISDLGIQTAQALVDKPIKAKKV